MAKDNHKDTPKSPITFSVDGTTLRIAYAKYGQSLAPPGR